MPAAKNPQTGPNPKKAPRRNRTKPSDPCFKKTREKIQTTQIVNRLQNNTLGKLKKEMTSGQIQSARLLIERTIPALTSIQHTGDEDNPIAITEVKRVIIDNA